MHGETDNKEIVQTYAKKNGCRLDQESYCVAPLPNPGDFFACNYSRMRKVRKGEGEYEAKSHT